MVDISRRRKCRSESIKSHLSNGQGSVQVGERLREIRTHLGLTVRALADLSSLNVNTLSLIENDHTSPSVDTLQRLAQSLKMPITAFFEADHGNKTLVFQKKDSRPQTGFAHGILEDLGAGMPYAGAEPLLMALFPYASSGTNPIVHTGSEFVYCLEGHIAYTVDNHNFILEPGDSLFFQACLPHYWKNPDETLSRALLMLYASDDRDKPSERHFLNS